MSEPTKQNKSFWLVKKQPGESRCTIEPAVFTKDAASVMVSGKPVPFDSSGRAIGVNRGILWLENMTRHTYDLLSEKKERERDMEYIVARIEEMLRAGETMREHSLNLIKELVFSELFTRGIK